ncbi:MAG TPA: hypothetical protein VI997_00885 [Candidatus Thermoplasmatota archaeon]|nr:hypothetical protein [Candidatus Thermoplasmatota archaeon]
MRRLFLLGALVALPAFVVAEDDGALTVFALGPATARDSLGATCDAELVVAFTDDGASFTLTETWTPTDRSDPVCAQMAANSGATSDAAGAPALPCGGWAPGVRTFVNGAHKIYAVNDCAGERVEHFVTLRNGPTFLTFSEEFRWASGLQVFGDAALSQRMSG